MRALVALVGLVAVSCQADPYPAPIQGTTYRISKDTPAKGSEVRVDLFSSWNECADAKIAEIDVCRPFADRASGEVKVSFDVRDPATGTILPRTIGKDQLIITHDNSRQDDFELIPHDPVSAGQLFIVVVDGSGSMYENDGERIKKVHKALLMPAVVDAFFPPGNNRTGVVVVRFSTTVTGLDGGPPRVLKSAQEYRATIKEHLLKQSGGFTHLYAAVRHSMTELLGQELIRRFLTVKNAEPTLVVLTDGFNNESGSDTCGTNVPKLQETVDLLREVRSGIGAAVRPRVFTVGLGQPYRKGDKPEGLNPAVTPTGLCGKYVDYPINGGLEKAGIDHVSLKWIAEAGGGLSFVKRTPKGLADVFQEAAAARYRWFELRYRVPDAFYHRKSFELRVALQTGEQAHSTVTLHPSAWIDAPSAERRGDELWTSPAPLRLALTVLMPTLGLLVLLFFIAPAWFNARRAIFRRARRRR